MHPILRCWAKAALHLLSLALFPQLVGAQVMHTFHAVVSNMTTTLQEKQVLSTLYAADPIGEFSVDRTEGSIRIKTGQQVEEVHLASMLEEYGVDLVTFTQPDRPTIAEPIPTPVQHGTRKVRLADMPLYIDTGDPTKDNARYDAAKATWIATHPAMYEELTAP